MVKNKKIKKFISILLLFFVAITFISCSDESYVCNRVEHYKNGNFSLGEDVRSTVKIKDGIIYVDLRKSICITEMQFRINSKEVDGNITKYRTTGNYGESHTLYIDHKENTIRMVNIHNMNNYTIILKNKS